MLTHSHIEVFRAVMIAGSVTKAAELLCSSQPTVSRELARMEQRIGLVLFDERIRGRLRPALQAMALYDEVRQSYMGLERVMSAAARLSAYQEGQLSVITLPAFSHAMVPGAFQRFHRRYPDVSLSVETQESPLLEEWLTGQRYDLGLTEYGEAPAGTRAELLMQVDEVCVLPDGHPLLARTTIALQDFHAQTFICLSPDDPYRMQIDEALAAEGVVPRAMIETPSAVSVCAFVRQGLGLAVVNPLTALGFVGNGLQLRPLTRTFPFRVNMVFAQHRPHNPRVPAFAAALREEAAEMTTRLSQYVAGASTHL